MRPASDFIYIQLSNSRRNPLQFYTFFSSFLILLSCLIFASSHKRRFFIFPYALSYEQLFICLYVL